MVKKKSVILVVVLLSLSILLILDISRGYEEKGDSSEDGLIVVKMDVDVEWLEDGENYLVNATVRALTTLYTNWTVRARIYSGEIVNTSEKLQVLLDNEPNPNKVYDTTEEQAGDLVVVDSVMYSDKQLNKGGYYGSCIYLEANNIIYRKIGLWIWIGSINVVKIYDTTDWIYPTNDIQKEMYNSADAGVPPTATDHFPTIDDESASYISNPGNIWGGVNNVVYTDSFNMPDNDWDEYTSVNSNVTLTNITVRARLNPVDTGFPSGYTYNGNVTMNTGEIYLWNEEGNSFEVGTVIWINNANNYVNLNLTDSWNGTTYTVNCSSADVTSMQSRINTLAVQLGLYTEYTETEIAVVGLGSAVSSIARNLAEHWIPNWEAYVNFVSTYWWIISAIGIVLVGYIKLKWSKVKEAIDKFGLMRKIRRD